MIVIALSLVCLALVVGCCVERERRMAADERWQIAVELAARAEAKADTDIGYYRDTVDELQRTVNKLSLQLAAKTFEDARSLEPNTITSVRRSDADLVKMSKEKADADKREDAMYEQIGGVK